VSEVAVVTDGKLPEHHGGQRHFVLGVASAHVVYEAMAAK